MTTRDTGSRASTLGAPAGASSSHRARGRVLSSFEAGTGTGEARPGHNDEHMQQVLNTRSIVLHTEY